MQKKKKNSEMAYCPVPMLTLKVYLHKLSRKPLYQFVSSVNPFTAVSPPASWNIRSTNKSSSSITVDWSGYPVDLAASFFIISLNETPRASHQKSIKLLSIAANASRTEKVVSGLPAFTSLVVTVYLVDINNVIYQSNTISVEGEGSGKSTSVRFSSLRVIISL